MNVCKASNKIDSTINRMTGFPAYHPIKVITNVGKPTFDASPPPFALLLGIVVAVVVFAV